MTAHRLRIALLALAAFVAAYALGPSLAHAAESADSTDPAVSAAADRVIAAARAVCKIRKLDPDATVQVACAPTCWKIEESSAMACASTDMVCYSTNLRIVSDEIIARLRAEEEWRTVAAILAGKEKP